MQNICGKIAILAIRCWHTQLITPHDTFQKANNKGTDKSAQMSRFFQLTYVGLLFAHPKDRFSHAEAHQYYYKASYNRKSVNYDHLFVWFNAPVNSYGHVKMVIFRWASQI